MFETTLDLVEDCGLTYLHVFPFSPRPGTPAARMPQLAAGTVRERAARLREAGRIALAGRLSADLGQRRSALVENGGIARTQHFLASRLDADAAPGQVVNIIPHTHDGRVMTSRLAG